MCEPPVNHSQVNSCIEKQASNSRMCLYIGSRTRKYGNRKTEYLSFLLFYLEVICWRAQRKSIIGAETRSSKYQAHTFGLPNKRCLFAR